MPNDKNEIQKILKNVTSDVSNLELEQLKEDFRVTKYKLQEINDILEGGLRSFNLKEMRNTYVINAQDSLDASYPMFVDFNIVSEMTKIVSIFVYFRIMSYRAYSTAAKSGGGATSGSGGGQTSSNTTTPSGGAGTSGANNLYTSLEVYDSYTDYDGESVRPMYGTGQTIRDGIDRDASIISKNIRVARHKHAMGNHTHTTPDHTHPAHNHTVADHTHTTPDHTHDITYGIHEENNSPTIKFYVSEDNGASFSDVFGPYKESQTGGIEITTFLEGIGNKLLKFESDLRARLSVQIIVKLDVKVR